MDILFKKLTPGTSSFCSRRCSFARPLSVRFFVLLQFHSECFLSNFEYVRSGHGWVQSCRLQSLLRYQKKLVLVFFWRYESVYSSDDYLFSLYMIVYRFYDWIFKNSFRFCLWGSHSHSLLTWVSLFITFWVTNIFCESYLLLFMLLKKFSFLSVLFSIDELFSKREKDINDVHGFLSIVSQF